MFQFLIKPLSEKENVMKNMKSTIPMVWIKKMNNIYNRATEIVNSEVIFV